jgi:two-component system, NtrC family, sensor kinase
MPEVLGPWDVVGTGWWQAGRIGCLLTKVLIPLVERKVGPEAGAALVRLAGHPRDYLLAEYNSLPISVMDELARLAMRLMGEPDEERWARAFAEETMNWRPSREQRAWGGAYTMSLGSPRAIYARAPITNGLYRPEILELDRARAVYRLHPSPAARLPRWACTYQRVILERFPTNWGLPRATLTERACAARGDPACEVEIRWKNAPLGSRFWGPVAAGAGGAALLLAGLARGAAPRGAVAVATALPVLLGAAVGRGLLERRRRREVERLRDLLADEILHSSGQLEAKFRDLHAKVDQLSLLIDLARGVSATLEPEQIYDQALKRLVHGMGYQATHLFLVDATRQRLRGHRTAGGLGAPEDFVGRELPLDASSAVGRALTRGEPVVVQDVEAAGESVDLPTARALGVRSLVSVPLSVKGRTLGVLAVVSDRPSRFAATDVELITAVASHVALAIDRAESFQTIEELSRGLEDKVRVRTEQLRATNEELQAAYRELQATQVQLIQREKMASVGQLVAGVAHELNNPIGFVSSNAATLEDFVSRLRRMVEIYRTVELSEADAARAGAAWQDLKMGYALRYLDPMLQGIKEGAERTRKIVRDLRVFARGDDDVWQPVDLHEELESSLTLLGHLLKNRVEVARKYGDLPAVECVRSQIDQVLLNILANAAQALEGRGTITIETRREEGWAVVAIGDTGPGIAPDVLGRVFDPFFTTKPVGEGTGLGLSISYEIVKKHGGDIGVESRPGQGATFTVRLPLGPRAADLTPSERSQTGAGG